MVANTVEQVRPRSRSRDAVQPVVLCVDDDQRVLTALRRVLRTEPCDVLATEDPSEALRWLEAEPVSVVIADLRMPQMSGLELLRAARAVSPGTGCLLLTGYPDDTSVKMSPEPVLTKPWDDEEMRRTIRTMLSWRTPRGTTAVTPGLAESVVWLECARAKSDALVKELYERAAHLPSSHRNGVVIILDNLPLLEDPIEQFLKALENVAGDWGVPFTLLDRYGAARSSATTMLTPHLMALGPEVGVGGERRFIVVDPNDAWQLLVRRTVDTLGHGCWAAASVSEARTRLRLGTFDSVMLELDQPGALDLAAEWRLGGVTPVVGVSSRAHLAELPAFKGARKSCYLTKPARFRDLLGVLRWAL